MTAIRWLVGLLALVVGCSLIGALVGNAVRSKTIPADRERVP